MWFFYIDWQQGGGVGWNFGVPNVAHVLDLARAEWLRIYVTFWLRAGEGYPALQTVNVVYYQINSHIISRNKQKYSSNKRFQLTSKTKKPSNNVKIQIHSCEEYHNHQVKG